MLICIQQNFLRGKIHAGGGWNQEDQEDQVMAEGTNEVEACSVTHDS